ncbi:hypothetical protein [Variovorax sp. HJSM1_2]|uniref:hypothetical protein n=1 Tax=Variovorax sp. HJSM1_2 TaxID=3366263 RepID=UPI003BDDEA8E
MRREVSVVLNLGVEYRFDLDSAAPMPNDLARWWLDDQFVRLGCEPLRASGKVLLADKVLSVAQAAGRDAWQDPKWFSEFARASASALGKDLVRLDVAAMAISY